MATILCITSNPDLDWNGTWKKDEVEQEMTELYAKPTNDTEWISWVLDHNFIDCKKFTNDLVEAVCNDAFVNGTFLLNGNLVSIIKV